MSVLKSDRIRDSNVHYFFEGKTIDRTFEVIKISGNSYDIMNTALNEVLSAVPYGTAHPADSRCLANDYQVVPTGGNDNGHIIVRYLGRFFADGSTWLIENDGALQQETSDHTKWTTCDPNGEPLKVRWVKNIAPGTSVNPGSAGAAGYAVLTGGAVTSVVITSRGSHYNSAIMSFCGGGGTGATGTVTVSGGGVTSIAVTAGGSGYTSPPTVIILGTGDTAGTIPTDPPANAGNAAYKSAAWTTGGTIQVLRPYLRMRATRWVPVVSQSTIETDYIAPYLGRCNNAVWHNGNPYTWLCTNVHVEKQDGIWLQLIYEFQYNPFYWYQYIAFSLDNSQRPPNLFKAFNYFVPITDAMDPLYPGYYPFPPIPRDENNGFGLVDSYLQADFSSGILSGL